jgi:hypothetical protein
MDKAQVVMALTLRGHVGPAMRLADICPSTLRVRPPDIGLLWPQCSCSCPHYINNTMLEYTAEAVTMLEYTAEAVR